MLGERAVVPAENRTHKQGTDSALMQPNGKKSSHLQRVHVAGMNLDSGGSDALAWGKQQGYAPPPPVVMPEGVDTLRQAPCASGGLFFSRFQRLPHRA